MDCASRTFFFRTDTDEDCAEWVQTLLAEIPSTPISPSASKSPVMESQKIEVNLRSFIIIIFILLVNKRTLSR